MTKTKIYFWYGVDYARDTAFIRIREEDKDKDSSTLVGLNRLLGRHGLDVDELITAHWRRYEAIPVPRWIIPILEKYYDMKELEEKEYLDPSGVR